MRKEIEDRVKKMNLTYQDIILNLTTCHRAMSRKPNIRFWLKLSPVLSRHQNDPSLKEKERQKLRNVENASPRICITCGVSLLPYKEKSLLICHACEKEFCKWPVTPRRIKDCGVGLFTTEKIAKGGTVAPYNLFEVNNTNFLVNCFDAQPHDDYPLRVRPNSRQLGIYANASCSKRKANCEFCFSETGEESYLKALRNIPKETEVLWNYDAICDFSWEEQKCYCCSSSIYRKKQ